MFEKLTMEKNYLEAFVGTYEFLHVFFVFFQLIFFSKSKCTFFPQTFVTAEALVLRECLSSRTWAFLGSICLLNDEHVEGPVNDDFETINS